MDNHFEIGISSLITKTKNILKDKLTGIYLHGSAVMGCFNPQKSDIDIIIIVNEKINNEMKKNLMNLIVEINKMAPKKGLEISVVVRNVCNPIIYPTPFELHFSPMHLNWYLNNPDDYIEKMNGVDKDLAAHFTMINHKGKCLFGLPINQVFGKVPHKYYIDAIITDTIDAKNEILNKPMYYILNLARFLAYIKDGLVLSKKKGGQWALTHLPIKYHQVVSTALFDYANDENQKYNEQDLHDYESYMFTQCGIN